MAETIEWVLADGSDGIFIAVAADYVSELRVNGQPLTQVRLGLRQQNARPKNRGNTAQHVSFVVTKAPVASAALAKQYVVDQANNMAVVARTHELLSGVFGALTWELVDAALESHDLHQIGTTVVARYSFIGGELTTEVAP